MSTPHVGDTERFVALSRRGTERREWSAYRTVALAAVIALGIILVLAVAGQDGKRVVELPDAAIAIIRMLLVAAILSFLGLTAYERIAPQWCARFAALRIGNRESEARIDSLQQQLTEANALSARTELWADQCNSRLHRMESAIEELGDKIRDYGADRRQDGIESTLRDNRVTQAGVRPYLLPPPRQTSGELRNGS